jgi:hypothetical protein
MSTIEQHPSGGLTGTPPCVDRALEQAPAQTEANVADHAPKYPAHLERPGPAGVQPRRDFPEEPVRHRAASSGLADEIMMPAELAWERQSCGDELGRRIDESNMWALDPNFRMTAA